MIFKNKIIKNLEANRAKFVEKKMQVNKDIFLKVVIAVTSVNDIKVPNLRTIQRTTPKRPKIKLELAEMRNIIPSKLKKPYCSIIGPKIYTNTKD